MQFVVEDGQLLDVYFWSRFVKYLISVIVDENLLAFRQLRKDVVFHLVQSNYKKFSFFVELKLLTFQSLD